MNFNKKISIQSLLILGFKRTRRFNFLLLMAIVVVSMFLFGCASSGQTDLASTNLDEALKILATRNHVCGVAITVIKDRKFDSMDFASGCQPALDLKLDSIFQAASLSKPIFAYAVLKLVAQGKLELDAPVVKYLPQGYRHQFNPLADIPHPLG